MTRRSTPAPTNTAVGTDPARLAPGTDVSRALWLLSGNECAWPQCDVRLLNANDDWVGEIAHIRGVRPTAARFDKSMTNEERRGYENLLLLCPTHHTQVDATAGRLAHTVQELEQIKRDHEARFRRVIAVLAEMEEQYLDLTTGNTVRYARTLAGLLPENTDEEREWNLRVAHDLADTLSRTTRAARQLLATVVEFKDQIGVPEAARRAGTTRERIYELIAELERSRLAEVYDNDYEPAVQQRIQLPVGGLGSDHLLDGWDFWDFLADYAAVRAGAIHDVIVGLDFALLDIEREETRQRPTPPRIVRRRPHP